MGFRFLHAELFSFDRNDGSFFFDKVDLKSASSWFLQKGSDHSFTMIVIIIFMIVIIITLLQLCS